jgi:hypothetical protein
MGLDMYLSKRSYVKKWDYMKPDEIHTIKIEKGGNPTDIRPDRITYVIEEVGYWRKFNALHNWFVENVQSGVDDCKEYYVDKNDLQNLLTTLKEVKDGRDKLQNNIPIAPTLLPTTPGFFFGSTEYDDYYYDEVDRTIGIVEEALKETGGFYYQASW